VDHDVLNQIAYRPGNELDAERFCLNQALETGVIAVLRNDQQDRIQEWLRTQCKGGSRQCG